jgi:hypothetical protein
MGTRHHQTESRAIRFPLHLPMHYRTPASEEWLEARTENVSRTGVLFETKRILEPSTEVDLKLEVPPPVGQGTHAEVICRCQVVRVEGSNPDRIAPVVAVEIKNYRFARRGVPVRSHETCRSRND